MSFRTDQDRQFYLSLLRLVSTLAETTECAILYPRLDISSKRITPHPDASFDFQTLLAQFSVAPDALAREPGITLFPISPERCELIVIRHHSGQALTVHIQSALKDLIHLLRSPSAHRKRPFANRAASYEALSEHIEQISYQSRKNHFGTILLALDQLHHINHNHGWDIADKVLNTLISRIQDLLPKDSFFGGFGGGQFIIITPTGTSAIGTQHLINAVQHLTTDPIVLDGHSISFTLSMGWSIFPEDGNTSDTLLLSTTAALTQAQMTGGGHNTRATTELTQRYHASKTLEQDLSYAITTNALFLRWMPIIDLKTHKIIGREALLRWNRPHFGEVSPLLFIQNAEKNGLIEQLDRWALREACSVGSQWNTTHRVCVNISPTWIINERLSHTVSTVLEETGLAPQRLQIEISERSALAPEHILFRELARVRALGVRIALDNFGSGSASLERLRTYPIDQLKLDRIFVERLHEDDRADDVMRCILRLGQMLNLSICAKGVETEQQFSFLDSHGCLEAQGFLFGPPAILT
ncbi:GGDEF domain-containing phosphodiesterase [Neokomagataea thailandica]|uniref:Sensory box/GGDEF family protein n=1 Tax=Neokomagataea tanensis NBRC 106556 TaxID=1223519 RepID=A0ABQ0QKF4_9PROT|nr:MULTISPECIES: GGDEF domain-containing phosphodiesterase [Neokomagataea]GBR47992.1 sensory box/GGDEF family protein [Neokomagataea tanensis NBRC 106556]